MGELTALTRRERFYLGVDVGRRHHTVCAVARSTFEAGDARWQSTPTLKVEVGRAGFDRIGQLLRRLTDDPTRDVVAALEPTGGYYARTVHAYLRSVGLEVRWVKNNAVHDARDAVYGKRTKTDPADSRLIARLLYLHEAVGQEYSFSLGHEQVGSYATLRMLVGNRWKLKQAQARAGNQLTQILDVVFPELATFFTRNVASTGALHVLERFPTPAALAEATREEVYEALAVRGHSYRKVPGILRLMELATSSVGIKDGIEDLITAETFLVQQLLGLEQQVSSLEQRICSTLAYVPEAKILLSFPTVTERRAATILAAMGAPISSFHSDKALRRHLGWSVEEERSGSSVAKERLARSGNRHSRRELRLMCWNLVNPRTPWTPFKAYYERLISPPALKRPNVALGHLASKVITVMYVCMSRGKPYDGAKLASDMGIELKKEQAAG